VSDAQAFVPARAEVSAVIIRACALCGSPRVLEVPCASCGNPDPPEVTDLGIVAATYRNPLRRAWRHLATGPLARRRIEAANRLHAETEAGP
jgi:hypothetical protein